MSKLLLLVAAVAALSGCVAVPYEEAPRHRTYGDRDRDGISNRADRDRDGDGVPNRSDRRPNNPRRY
jgi:uncharacterized protein YceK